MQSPELGADMQRREFITLLGGVVAAWPLTAQAQQPARLRRIGVLVAFTENDLEFAGFAGGVQKASDRSWLD